jgi:hypothetical protein
MVVVVVTVQKCMELDVLHVIQLNVLHANQLFF